MSEQSGNIAADQLKDFVELQPEPPIYTELAPWMIGRLVEIKVFKLERRSYTQGEPSPKLQHTNGGRLQRYKTGFAGLDGGSVEWGRTTPIFSYNEGEWWALEITVTSPERDVELREAHERTRLTARASFLLGPGAAPAATQITVGPTVTFSMPQPRRRRARIAGRMHE